MKIKGKNPICIYKHTENYKKYYNKPCVSVIYFVHLLIYGQPCFT